MNCKLLSAKILGKAGTQLVSVWLFVWLFAECYVNMIIGLYVRAIQ